MPAQLVGDFGTVNSRIAQERIPLAIVTLRDRLLNSISERLFIRGVPGARRSRS